MFIVIVTKVISSSVDFESHQVARTYCAGVYETLADATVRAEAICGKKKHKLGRGALGWYRSSAFLLDHKVSVVEIPEGGDCGILLSRSEFDYVE